MAENTIGGIRPWIIYLLQMVSFHSSFRYIPVFILFLATLPLWSQGFGKNKVQTGNQEWFQIKTEHFDVYFHEDEGLVGEYAVLHLESMLDSIESFLGHELKNRVPIVLYASQSEFQQTNIIPYLLPEGVGGFTEVFKNRVVLPFTGSYPELHHVLFHELVHAYMNDMAEATGSRFGQTRPLPLWFSEGLAEYISLKWNLESDFFIRDAVNSGYIGNPRDELPGYLAYKGGQAFFNYLAHTFGEDAVARLVKRSQAKGELEGAFRDVTGASLEEIGEVWLRELRSVYWPSLRGRHYGKLISRQLTDHVADPSNFNLQPAISPDGKKLAYFSDRKSAVGVYIMDLETEEIERSLLFSGFEEGHLSFHPYQSAISWSPDGKSLAVVSQSGGRDVIRIVLAKSGSSREVIDPGLEAISSPAWSPDGRYIAFSGVRLGLSDLYLWDRETKELKRLTYDIADDRDPAFAPSGQWLAFSSDRLVPVLVGDPKDPFLDTARLGSHRDIYRISLSGGEPERLIGGPYGEYQPTFGPDDSSLVFISNRSGIANLYLAKLSEEGWKIGALTNLQSWCFSASWSADGGALAFTLFEKGGWDIFLMETPLERKLLDSVPETQYIQIASGKEDMLTTPIPLENLSSFGRNLAYHKSDSKSAAGIFPEDLQIREQRKRITAESKRKLAESDTSILPDTLEVSGARLAKGESFLTSITGHKVEPYKLQWGLDAAQVNLAYNTFARGAAGQTFISLSDILGNHRLSFTFSSAGFNLRSTNVMGIYDFLRYRTDYEFLAYHLSDIAQIGPEHTLLDRQWGGAASFIYPLSIFTRFQVDLEGFTSTRSLWQGLLEDRATDSSLTAIYPREVIRVVRPRIGWTNDNTQFGIVGPVIGRRMHVNLSYVPSLDNEISFVVLDSDLRHYFRFAKKYTLAMRFSGGWSHEVAEGRNPHHFLAGGDNLIPVVGIDRQRENVPEDLEEVTFSELAIPLRGFRYYDFKGNRKLIGNLEFRYPFIEEFRLAWPLSITLRHVMGNVFTDYGGAWNQGTPWDILGLGYGWGMRLNLGVFVLRYTQAYQADFVGKGVGGRIDYWSIGAEF